MEDGNNEVGRDSDNEKFESTKIELDYGSSEDNENEKLKNKKKEKVTLREKKDTYIARKTHVLK